MGTIKPLHPPLVVPPEFLARQAWIGEFLDEYDRLAEARRDGFYDEVIVGDHAELASRTEARQLEAKMAAGIYFHELGLKDAPTPWVVALQRSKTYFGFTMEP